MLHGCLLSSFEIKALVAGRKKKKLRCTVLCFFLTVFKSPVTSVIILNHTNICVRST